MDSSEPIPSVDVRTVLNRMKEEIDRLNEKVEKLQEKDNLREAMEKYMYIDFQTEKIYCMSFMETFTKKDDLYSGCDVITLYQEYLKFIDRTEIERTTIRPSTFSYLLMSLGYELANVEEPGPFVVKGTSIIEEQHRHTDIDKIIKESYDSIVEKEGNDGISKKFEKNDDDVKY